MIVTDDATVLHILKSCRTVAIVGLSADESRPSFTVAHYLQANGYRIIPVNPKCLEVLGERGYPSLLAVSEPIDMVNCFRKSEEIPAIVEDMLTLKSAPKVLWTQQGIVSEAAAARAHAAGISVVMDRCLKIEHKRLIFPTQTN